MTTEQQATKKEGVATEALKNAQEETKHAMLMIQTSTGITLDQVTAELRKKFPHVTAEMAARIYTEASRQLVLEKDRKNATKYFLQEKASGNWPDAYTMQRMFPRLLSTWQQAKEFQEELMKKYGENNHKPPKAETIPPVAKATPVPPPASVLSNSKAVQPPQTQATGTKTEVPQNINGSKSQPPQNITEGSIIPRGIKPKEDLLTRVNKSPTESIRAPLWREFNVYADDSRCEDLLLETIVTQVFSPRATMDDEYIKSLAQSLREEGQERGILVTPREGKLAVVSGECRVLAARKLGWTKIKGLSLLMTDEQAIAMALAANLEHDLPHLALTPVEEAKQLKKLITEHDWTQEKAGQFFTRTKAWVSYRLDLLKAPEGIKKGVQEGTLTARHARALSGLPDSAQEKAAGKIVEEDLSVRQTEELARNLKAHPEPAKVTPEEMDAMLARNREEINKSMPIGKALQDAGAIRMHKDDKGIYFFTNTCPVCGNQHTINLNIEEGFALLTRPKDLKAVTIGGKAS